MNATNKKGVAAQALMEMDEIVSAIKEESKKSLSTMLSEAVKGAIRESVEDDDEDEYSVIDDDKNGAEDEDEKSDKKSTEDVSEDENDEVDAMGQEDPNAAQMTQPQGGAQAQAPAQQAPVGMEGGDTAEMPTDGDGEEGWDDFSKYQVGDDTYDLTGENDYDSVVKVYKLLKDDDQVVIQKQGDSIKLQDNAAGTEYVIDLGTDDEGAQEDSIDGEEEDPTANLSEGIDDIAGFPGDENDEFGPDDEGWDEREDELGELGSDNEMPHDFGGHFDDADSFEEDFDNIEGDEFDDDDIEDDGLDDGTFASDDLEEKNNFAFENKKMKKPMKESKEVLFEVDLGYTDNYQDKDPIKGLSNNEPSKSGKSWHKGVPTGTEKPWAGPSKDKGKPFGEKTVDEEEEKCCPKCGKCGAECTCEKEVDEATNTGGFVQQNTTVGSHIPNSNGRKARSQRSASQGVEVTGTADPRYKGVNESKELKAIKAENRELKKAVLELRKNLNEAYITNVNLGKITKLFLENTTSKAEKIDIVNRFSNEAKTVEQSKALYESIDRELKKVATNPMSINESSKTAKGTKELNENKVYNSNDLIKTIDLMNRVMDC